MAQQSGGVVLGGEENRLEALDLEHNVLAEKLKAAWEYFDEKDG